MAPPVTTDCAARTATDFFRCYEVAGRIDHDLLKLGVQDPLHRNRDEGGMRQAYQGLSFHERYKVLTTLEKRKDYHTILSLLELTERLRKLKADRGVRKASRVAAKSALSAVIYAEPASPFAPTCDLWCRRYLMRVEGLFLTLAMGRDVLMMREQTPLWPGPRRIDLLYDYDLDGFFEEDAFPLDPDYHRDSDLDGVPDGMDSKPEDPREWVDLSEPKVICSEDFPGSPLATVSKEGERVVLTLKIFAIDDPALSAAEVKAFKEKVKRTAEGFYLRKFKYVGLRIEYVHSRAEAHHVVYVGKRMPGDSLFKDRTIWQNANYWSLENDQQFSEEEIWAHEIGHLLGLAHASEQMLEQSSFSYWRFYQDTLLNLMAPRLMGSWRTRTLEGDGLRTLVAEAKAAAACTSDRQRRYEEVRIAIERQDYARAERMLRSLAMEMGQTHPFLLDLRAYLASASGRLEIAENAYRHMLQADPLDPGCFNNLRAILLRRGNFRAVADMYEQADVLYPAVITNVPATGFLNGLFKYLNHDGEIPTPFSPAPGPVRLF